jgi:hypothetical protein
MKMLLMWKQLPENSKTFIVDEDSAIAILAEQVAGRYINSDNENDALHELNDLLEHAKDVPQDKPLIGPFSRVVVCGFYM